MATATAAATDFRNSTVIGSSRSAVVMFAVGVCADQELVGDLSPLAVRRRSYGLMEEGYGMFGEAWKATVRTHIHTA